MSKKRFKKMNCSAAQTLELVGDWWTLLIVREAFYGSRTFSTFCKNLGISRNILTERLAWLVEHGIFERRQPNPDAERFSYHLTEKGHELLPILVALMQWGDRWVAGKGNEPVCISDANGKPIALVSVFGKDGRPLKVGDLRFAPGPGASKTTRARFNPETG